MALTMSSLFAALGVTTVLVHRWLGAPSLTLDDSFAIELSCAAVAGAVGALVAWAVINPAKRPSRRWGALAGLFAVVLGHVLGMSMMTALLIPSEQAPLAGVAKWAATSLVFALGSFAFVGWFTLPIGLVLGIVCWRPKR